MAPTQVKQMTRPYSQIYDRLMPLLPENWQAGFKAYKLHSDGFMPLSVEYLGNDPLHSNRLVISLTHYYEQNGDLMRDPDMTISISTDPEWPVAEALSFEMSAPPLYQAVYTTGEDGKARVYPKLKKQLNSFLLQWLRNLHNQGFGYQENIPAIV